MSAGVWFRVIDPIVGRVALNVIVMALAFIAMWMSPLGREIRFSWSSLSVGDWLSVLFFPVSSIIGWSDYWKEIHGSLKVVYVGSSAMFHCLLFWALMMYIMRMARSIRSKVGRLNDGASSSYLAEHRAYVYHVKNCVSGNALAKRKERVRYSALKRRKFRNSLAWRRVFGMLESVADSYEDSSAWLSAALASGGLFTWAVQDLSPGPGSAVVFLIPFVLIPIVYQLRQCALSLSV